MPEFLKPTDEQIPNCPLHGKMNFFQGVGDTWLFRCPLYPAHEFELGVLGKDQATYNKVRTT